MTALSSSHQGTKAPRTVQRRTVPRPPRSSRPYPVHAEVFEEVMLDKSGRLTGKRSAAARSHDPVIAGTTKRRNELLLCDDPAWKLDKDGNVKLPPPAVIARRKQELALKLAFSRHPKWLGVKKAEGGRRKAEPEPPAAPCPLPVMPLFLRVPDLRARPCRACLKSLTGPLPVPADFTPRFKQESGEVLPAHVPDLLA